jgi:hypothetical protein
MRFRAGAVVGFALGYYLGAKAGRERYEQLRRAVEAVPLGSAAGKVKALGQLAAERVRPTDT